MSNLSPTEFFNQNGYFELKNVISAPFLNYMKNVIFFDTIQRPNQTDDDIAPLTETRYASPTTEALLLELQPYIERVVGEPLLPSYSYHRIYKPGDFLKPHKDRNACEISLTLNIGAEYFGVPDGYSWDIWAGDKKFTTRPGDILIYKGMELEHWRDTFEAGEGSWQLQTFLHYVKANGENAYYAYDNRQGLGYN